MTDLRELAPTPSELLEAARWTRTHDPSAAFRDQLERVRPLPKVPEWERIATELRVIVERVVHGDIAADRALAQLDARVDAMLEKRRWMLDRGAGT